MDASAPRRAVSNQTRNSFRRCTQTLFLFAKSQRYLPSDWDALGSVPRWKVKAEAVEIFTAEEMTLVLALAPANLVPFLAIGGFAGLRTAEIERLDWSKVDLEGSYITVDASIAKANSRRLVPIAPNLKAWLAGHKRPESGQGDVGGRGSRRWVGPGRGRNLQGKTPPGRLSPAGSPGAVGVGEEAWRHPAADV